MKTKFYWVALFASAALIAQAQAGGHHSGGGGHSSASAVVPARGAGVSSFHSMPGRSFRGGRMMYSGGRFAPGGMRQFNPRSFNRDDRFARLGNNPQFAQGRNGFAGRNGATGHQRNGGRQIRNGNNLPLNWQNHVASRHSADWHHDWDRGRDHRWHGHHCRFINGSWVIFDLGFYPGGRTDIHTTTTATIPIHMDMAGATTIRACMTRKTTTDRTTTIRPMDTPTRRLPLLKSDLHAWVITLEKSTGFSARKRGAPLRATKATAATVQPAT